VVIIRPDGAVPLVEPQAIKALLARIVNDPALETAASPGKKTFEIRPRV